MGVFEEQFQSLKSNAMAISKKTQRDKIGCPKIYLWSARALTIGSVNGTFCTNNMMNTFALSLNNPILVEDSKLECAENSISETQAILIEPGSQLKLSVNNSRLILLSILALTADREVLLDSYPFKSKGMYHTLEKPGEALLAYFRDIDDQELDANAAGKLVDLAINPRGRTKVPKIKDGRIRELVIHMLNNPAQVNSSEEIAKRLGFSKYRFLHLFKSEVGMTYGNFKKILKMKAFTQAFARYRKITDSAHEANFTDLAHFSNRFKTISGLTPGQFYGDFDHLRLFID